MEGFPTALILAREEDVLANRNVLFRLVQPADNRIGVKSAAGLVNVIPQKRIYRMETTDEIEIFKREILKRPLVLQPVSHAGFGLGKGPFSCGFCYDDERWVLLINQTHPKILSRLQMGADAAKKAMERGDPFLLRYKFGDVLQRLHFDLFTIQDIDSMSVKFQHAEWEFAELVIRFPGRSHKKKVGPSTMLATGKCVELNFDFADVGIKELGMVHNAEGVVVQGPMEPITENEIRDLLPGWTVNEISPLDNIGEAVPETYNYAQAGRLYESFRRKKRQRSKVQSQPESTEMRGRIRGLYSAPRDCHDNEIDIDDVETSFNDVGQTPYRTDTHTHVSRKKKEADKPSTMSYNPDAGNLYPGVNIVKPPRDRSGTGSSEEHEWYNCETHERTSHEAPSLNDRLNHRGSDRSSHSTIASSNAGADSGYSGADSDGNGHNGYGRYDGYRGYSAKNREYQSPRGRFEDRRGGRAHENRAFIHDDIQEKDIVQKHQAYVNKMRESEHSSHYDRPKRSENDFTKPDGYDRPSANVDRGDNRHQDSRHSERGDKRNDKEFRQVDRGYNRYGRPRHNSHQDTTPDYDTVIGDTRQYEVALADQEQMSESFI